MPDPRLPQKPQSRQPAPQPHKGPPQERPGPDRPGGGSSARPVRMLDPSQQAPPVEFERKLRKGETYWVMGTIDVPTPRKAKVVRLSNEPGKPVGVEFEEPVGGVNEQGEHWGVTHDCDGHGKQGHCLYIMPDQALDDRAMELHKAHTAEWEEARVHYEEYEEMTVGPQHSQVPTPAPPDRERMTIRPEDVGTIHVEDLTKGKDK